MNFQSWFQEVQPDILPASLMAVLKLAEEGGTVPFIARYRKEQTGSLDEVKIQAILDGKEKWEQILQRQTFIVGEIEHQKKLTPELKAQLLATFKLELLEDLYLPYKQKRKTKAALAKEAGLEPLAEWIWACGHGLEVPQPGQTLELWAFTFHNPAKEIPDAQAAIAGAQDILIERLSEMQHLRQLVRTQIFARGTLRTQKTAKAKENSKFETYFQYQESITSLLLPQNSHRYLAIKRGWGEKDLSLSMEGPAGEEEAFEASLLQAFEAEACTHWDSPGAEVLKKAARLSFKAHVFASIENEVHKALREVADAAAIQVFAENVRKLLLASPFGAKGVLGVDPGLRTGCKLAVVDEAGKYITSTVMYLNSESDQMKAAHLLVEVLKNAQLSAIAVGNGTGGRETETFIRKVLQAAGSKVPVVMVSEAGASVYSASEAAREEFAALDLTVRGAISIARRLQDPLAELVKIDPKSIGVGQYQHDVSPHGLKRSLGQVVESCVNQVGVNLNTASYHLLAYVAGVGPALAKALVEYREQKGLFQSRAQLESFSRFTKKAFEQAAGFLRIPQSAHPLDNTGVHPENYEKLEQFALSQGKQVKDLTGPSGVQLLKKNPAFRESIGPFTFDDIVKELEKPGRDPREEFVYFQFREDIHEVKDLKPGLLCPGIVTNVTNFGAFVDIGVHQDGLVHISQLSDQYVKDPRDVVSPGDRVQARVLEVNFEKGQISLSLKKQAKAATSQMASGLEQKLSASSSGGGSGSNVARKVIAPLKSGGSQDKRQPAGRHGKSGGGVVGPGVIGSSPGASSGSSAPGASSSRPSPRPAERASLAPRGPKEAFNNPFGALASLRGTLKRKD